MKDSHPDLTAEDITELRKSTLYHLGKVCGWIEEIMNNQNVDLSTIKLPGEDDDEYMTLIKLKAYKTDLNRTLQRINGEGGAAYGICLAGGEFIPKAELMGLAWAETCQSHAGKPFTVVQSFPR